MQVRFVPIGAGFSPSDLSNRERRPVIGEKAEFAGNVVPHGSVLLSNEMLTVFDTEALTQVTSLNLDKGLSGLGDRDLIPQVKNAATRWNRASHDEAFDGGCDPAFELLISTELGLPMPLGFREHGEELPVLALGVEKSPIRMSFNKACGVKAETR